MSSRYIMEQEWCEVNNENNWQYSLLCLICSSSKAIKTLNEIALSLTVILFDFYS